MDIGSLAFRTGSRPSRSERNGPFMLTVAADKVTFRHLTNTSLDIKRPAVDEDIRGLTPGRSDDISEGLARDAHFLRRILLVKPFVIRQAKGFEFVEGQDNLDEFGDRDSGRLENISRRIPSHSAADERPGH
jgi:hypothetical protein